VAPSKRRMGPFIAPTALDCRALSTHQTKHLQYASKTVRGDRPRGWCSRITSAAPDRFSKTKSRDGAQAKIHGMDWKANPSSVSMAVGRCISCMVAGSRTMVMAYTAYHFAVMMGVKLLAVLISRQASRTGKVIEIRPRRQFKGLSQGPRHLDSHRRRRECTCLLMLLAGLVLLALNSLLLS
jgi:hypothetical protein